MAEFSHIKVNVRCHLAENAVYRIYVDNNLITERTFSWPTYNVYIRENLICNLESGIHHLTVENCSKKGYFELFDFSLNDETNCVLNIQPYEDSTGRILTFQKTNK